MNDKITISLYYKNKLDVENEKDRLQKFAVNGNSMNEAGEFFAKLPLIFLLFTMGVFFSTENFLTLLLLSIDDRLTR